MISRRRSSGFTIVEMIITVLIISILATMVVPFAKLNLQRTKENELRYALRQIRDAIDAYKAAVDEDHIVRNADESGYPARLSILVEGVVDQKDPNRNKIYFLRRIPSDPFTSDKTLPPERTWGLRSYRSPPDDPQEGRDVYDVYSLSSKIGLNDVPYREW